MFRSRISIAAGAALAVVVLASAALLVPLVATASASPSGVAAGGGATVKLRSTSVGKILVAKNGFTLYAFGADRRNQDRCVKRSGCTGLWPLFTTRGRPNAGRGVNRSMLGTIKVNGKSQVTYGGRPLYEYSADSSPGATSYLGVSQFGGKWRGVRASGKLVG
jgi:predicted lipoprotein with Yx(FWY)xxD motif